MDYFYRVAGVGGERFSDRSVVRDGKLADPSARRKPVYKASKRAFDVSVCILALPLFLGLCAVLLIANRSWNPGPLFYCQRRKGKGFRDFVMIKFRTMLPRNEMPRGAYDPLEISRITPLGHWMRRTRLDEIPQIINVLIGDMSLVGPRPEISNFADAYACEIDGYKLRGAVRPGISGYAQVKLGYVDSKVMVARKTELDIFYVWNMGWRMDLLVLLRTVTVIFTAHGAR